MNYDDFHKLCKHPLLDGLHPSDQAKIRKTAHIRPFPARTQVLAIGEKSSVVHLILVGSVKLLARYDINNRQGADKGKTDDENETLIAVLGFGDFIGAFSVLSAEEQIVSAWTVEATRVATFGAHDFLAMLEQYPQISRNFNVHLARTVQQLIGHSLSLSTLDVPGRLAFQLLRFARQHGQLLEDGSMLVEARLTQNDLAHLCGASREQINRILKVWKRQSLVSTKDKNFLIHNTEVLERLTR